MTQNKKKWPHSSLGHMVCGLVALYEIINGHGNLTDVQLSIKALQEVKAGGPKVIVGSHICVLVGVAIQNGMIVMGGMKNFQSSVKLKEVCPSRSTVDGPSRKCQPLTPPTKASLQPAKQRA